jgi:hypothetical protein
MMTDDPRDSFEMPPEEPEFDIRRGLKLLLIIGAIVIIISMICIGFWPSET